MSQLDEIAYMAQQNHLIKQQAHRFGIAFRGDLKFVLISCQNQKAKDG